MATQKLFVEVSEVMKRREPHMWVAELTSHVECKPRTVRRNTAHIITERPNGSVTRASTVIGTQWYSADPHVKFVLAKVGNVGQEFRGVLVHGLAGNDPSHVSPQAAILRGVGIALFVGVLMMDAMSGDPGDGTTFKGESTARG